MFRDKARAELCMFVAEDIKEFLLNCKITQTQPRKVRIFMRMAHGMRKLGVDLLAAYELITPESVINKSSTL